MRHGSSCGWSGHDFRPADRASSSNMSNTSNTPNASNGPNGPKGPNEMDDTTRREYDSYMKDRCDGCGVIRSAHNLQDEAHEFMEADRVPLEPKVAPLTQAEVDA